MPPVSPQHDDHAMLITWLSTHDAPCPACKYNLRHLTEPRCPECGQPLSLAIATSQPFSRTWIATALLLWSNAFPSLYFLTEFTHELLTQHHIYFPRESRDRLLVIFYLSATPLAIAFLFLRRRFTRLPKQAQISIVAFLAAATLIGFDILISDLVG
jgi:hypothetical protein